MLWIDTQKKDTASSSGELAMSCYGCRYRSVFIIAQWKENDNEQKRQFILQHIDKVILLRKDFADYRDIDLDIKIIFRSWHGLYFVDAHTQGVKHVKCLFCRLTRPYTQRKNLHDHLIM